MGAFYWVGISFIACFVGLTIIIVGGPWEILPVCLVLGWALGVAFFPKHLQPVKDIGGQHDNNTNDPPAV